MIPSTVDETTGTVVAQLTHFSTYTLLSPSSPWYAGWGGVGAVLAVVALALLGIGRSHYRLRFVSLPTQGAVGQPITLRLQMRSALGMLHRGYWQVPAALHVPEGMRLSGGEGLAEREGATHWNGWRTGAGTVSITPKSPGTYTVRARLTRRIGPLRLPFFRPSATWRIQVR